MTLCIEWTGALTGAGYGAQAAYGTQGAHRIAWIEANGPIPHGLQVLHACDNRKCVNVAHLRLGTHAENMADRNTRGRQAKDERHGMTKLSREQVAWIRESVAGGMLQKDAAKALGVSRSLVSHIIKGTRRAA